MTGCVLSVTSMKVRPGPPLSATTISFVPETATLRAKPGVAMVYLSTGFVGTVMSTMAIDDTLLK